MQEFKKILIIIVLIAGLGSAAYFLFKEEINDLRKNDASIGALERDLKDLHQEIFTSGPLRFNGNAAQARLTIVGVVEQTNQERIKEGLLPLSSSDKLNISARLKVDDMFERQYFEHESPSGEGPADLANKVHYAFVMVGENLALGNFENDSALVDGWMASPGHRENILRSGYTEIGVAVRQGIFEGKKTWMAVQEFGTPSSVCPSPDPELASKIDANKVDLSSLETTVNQKKQELDAYEPKRGPEYEQKVREYNNLVENYNQRVQEIKTWVSEYNKQADAYNACLKQFKN